jgi:predicted metal-dependent phosphoesterase TrpH
MQEKLITHRVLLHNHSTWSDGRLSLKEVARLGGWVGASAIAMSEHDFDFSPQKWAEYKEACRLESTKACLLIPGIEYSSPDDNIHVVTIGAMSYFGARRDLVETLAAVRAEGGATILAHPRRRDSFNKITPELLQQIDAIEIWNRKVDGVLPVRSYFRFARSRDLATTVGMDLHTRRQIFPMWNIVAAAPGPIDGEVIAAALRTGAIAPACFMGQLSPALDHGFSVKIGILTAAERLRELLRELRDTISPRSS